MQQPDSASSTPIASTSVAAVRWFELLANDASRDIFPEAENESNVLEGGFLDPFNNQDESTTTPLQQATKLIDGNPEDRALIYEGTREEDMWQASENISLLEREQVLYRTFLYRICPWVSANYQCSIMSILLMTLPSLIFSTRLKCSQPESHI